MPEQFSRLFSPIKVGSMTVPNRIAETTHLITIGRLDGLPDDGFIAYHAQKARSGVGWIGNQTWMVGMPKRLGSSARWVATGRATMQGLWDRPDFNERMKRFFDAIHQYGSVAVMQLTFITTDFGPSSEPRARSSDDIPHEMEVEEIQEMVQIFAKAAQRFREAGADGVELHGSHECMPEIFFSPIHNKRTDQYGGSLENRTRFAREILAAMKASAGKDFTVGL
ncbi:MAG: hypothetical protein HY677_01085, partial [Chloroflexi bacterium]|nr:hypothetical protein [Chloroflexota bacterium]